MTPILGWMVSPGFQVWQLSCNVRGSSVETEAAGRSTGVVHDLLSACWVMLDILSISMEPSLPFVTRRQCKLGREQIYHLSPT